MTIDIYKRVNGEHHPLSNFAPFPSRYMSVAPTAEHCFQAAKFMGFPSNAGHIAAIFAALTPSAAKKLGKSRKHPIDPCWDNVRVAVMEHVLRNKLLLNPEVRAALGATGQEQIVEGSPWDYFWGTGKSGKGRNELGKLWMKIRDEGA